MDSQIKAALILGSATVVSAIITGIVTLIAQQKFSLLDKINSRIFGSKKSNKSTFFSSKKYLPPYAKSINLAKDEICLMSIHAINFIRCHESLIEEKLKSGCKIRIIGLQEKVRNQTNPNIKSFQDYTLHNSVHEDIIASDIFTKGWIGDLDNRLKNKIQIKFYENFPTVLALIIDKDKDNGFAIVEPIFPYLKTKERIAFKICNSDNKNLMSNISKSFELLWEKSTT